MDVVDSGIRILQTVFPPAMQYWEKAKEREAKEAEEEQELAQAKAQTEILTIKNRELAEAHQELNNASREILEANKDLQAFKDLVIVLVVVAAVMYVGMALSSRAA